MCCRRKIGWLALACLGLGKAAMASEWGELKASVMQQVLYNDNIQLNATQKQPVFGYILNPSVRASHTTETFDIGLNAQGNIRRYDSSIWDCENYTIGLNSKYKTRRSVFALTGTQGISCAYAQQAQQTGVVIPGAQATSYNVAPSWTWQWTPRSQVSLGAAYTKRSYGGSSASSTVGTGSTSPTGYSNYDSYTVNLGMNHAWSQRLGLNGGVYFMNSQYAGATGSTQTLYGFQVGGQYMISQNWVANLDGGLRMADIQRNTVVGALSTANSSSLGTSANVSVSYNDRLNRFSTGYSNAAMPSSIGQTLQNHTLYANYSYQLAPHLSWNTGGSFLHSQPISSQSAIALANASTAYGRDYFTATTALAWEFARDWKLSGSYAYRWQKLKQQANAADSNAVMLTLNYAWDGIED